MDLFKLVGTIVINNTEANEEIEDTTDKAEGLSKALAGTTKSADSAGRSMGSSGKFGAGSIWLGNMLVGLTTGFGKLGKAIGKTGFKQNSDLEKYMISFTAMLGGNSEAAEKLIGDLQELASVTPLNTSGIIKNANMLFSTQKVPLEEMVDTLRMLGDVAKGDQNDLDGITRAYSQVMSAGKLNAEDLNQMADRQVPIWQMVADQMGIEQSHLRDLVRKSEIPASVLTETLKKATSEGGIYYQQMEKQAESFNGKMATLEDNAVITAGDLTQPFFDVAKSDVLPRLSESLEAFGEWATANKDTLTAVAEAMGKFATIAFDGVLDFFKWLTENGESVATAIGVIGTAMGIAAVTAHPYAAAVTAVAGALMYLNSEAGQKRGTFDHMFDGYTNEQLQVLNQYVDAMNALKQAEDAALNDTTGNSWGKYDEAYSSYEAALEEVKEIEGLLATYNTWHSAQEGYEGANGFALKVQLQTDENAESSMQTEIDNMAMEAVVSTRADTSGMIADIKAANVTKKVSVFSSVGGFFSNLIDGSHASGLDYVPHDGYIAELHEGETVLNRTNAEAWRSGGGASISTSGIEAKLDQLISIMSGGQQVVLDTGILCGQLATKMDAQLGTISNRKGRRN